VAGSAGSRRRSLAAGVGGLAALGLVLSVAGPPRARADAAALPRLGPAPNFALTTQQNDRLWLTHFRDRVVVLTFFCTTCDACSAFLDDLIALSRALGWDAGRRVFFVAVSVDPGRDTTAVLRRFARERRADLTTWVFFTGVPAQVDVVLRWYGIAVERDGGQLRHPCAATLIDGAGLIRGWYEAGDLERLREGLASLLAERP
jgi:protein SCO1/2